MYLKCWSSEMLERTGGGVFYTNVPWRISASDAGGNWPLEKRPDLGIGGGIILLNDPGAWIPELFVDPAT